MPNNYFQKLYAERIGGEKFEKTPYVNRADKLDNAKKTAMEMRPEQILIDLSSDEPDAMADLFIVDELAKEASKWNNRGRANNTRTVFCETAGDYMKNVFSVEKIKYDKEIIHTSGIKLTLSMIAQAFINPGDVTLMTTPGTDIIGKMTEWLGGEVYKLPLKEENAFLPQLKVPGKILKRAKLLYISYPNNPTGGIATKDFFANVIEFAKANNLIVVHDAAYAALTYDNTYPLSILSVKGAKKCAIELHSLSNSFNMSGWRLGFAVGNQHIIKALSKIKESIDSGQFKAIQLAGKYALEHFSITDETSEKYSRRFDYLVPCLQKLGFDVQKPKAGQYIYVKIPCETSKGVKFKNAQAFADYLLNEKSILVTPFDQVGHYVRISITFQTYGKAEELSLVDEISNRLADESFIF